MVLQQTTGHHSLSLQHPSCAVQHKQLPMHQAHSAKHWRDCVMTTELPRHTSHEELHNNILSCGGARVLLSPGGELNTNHIPTAGQGLQLPLPSALLQQDECRWAPTVQSCPDLQCPQAEGTHCPLSTRMPSLRPLS